MKQQEDRQTKALYEVIFHHNALELKRLLEAGANPNAFNDSENNDHFFRRRPPLSEAAWQGYSECMKVLIGAGADIHAIDVEGWNALHFTAYHSDSPDICPLLIQMGIDTISLIREVIQ